MALLGAFVFVFGLLIGSFLNVVAIRLPRGESIVFPPSHCPACGRRLRACELVPVLSYLFLRGKCRSCRRRISPLYVWGELATGLLFLLLFARIGWSLELPAALALAACLIAASLSDWLYRIIPNKLVFFGMGLFALFRLFHHPLPLGDYWVGFFTGGGIVWLVNAATRFFLGRDGMGGGDLKLFALIGLAAGWKITLLAFFFASFFGAVAGIYLLAKRKVKRGEYIPFAPSIALGTVVAYLWGPDILDWYLGFYR
ncbi:A24 family peptidase [Bacillaceae bacterium]